TASLFGGPGGNTFRGAPTSSSLTASAYDLLLLGFFTVNASAGSSSDAAYLTDSPGADSFVARPDGSASLSSQTFSLNVRQFAAVAAYASVGNDSAALFGRAGLANSFAAGPVGTGINVASLSSPGVYTVATVGFASVQATAGSSNDVAQLTDSAGDDVYIG